MLHALAFWLAKWENTILASHDAFVVVDECLCHQIELIFLPNPGQSKHELFLKISWHKKNTSALCAIQFRLFTFEYFGSIDEYVEVVGVVLHHDVCESYFQMI